nr:LOW QUALITY PROTEIN: uncharacterized protein LOC129280136 [Lytechinus pictus]
MPLPATTTLVQRCRRPPPTPQARAHPPAVSHWTRVTPREVQHNDASRPSFTARNPGPRQVPARNSDPIKYFDDDMMVHITRETNRYADTFLSNAAIVEWIRGHPHSRFKRWPAGGITVAQLKEYFGLSINMGLVVKKRLDNYWSMKPSQLTPFFSSVMPHSEFAFIARDRTVARWMMPPNRASMHLIKSYAGLIDARVPAKDNSGRKDNDNSHFYSARVRYVMECASKHNQEVLIYSADNKNPIQVGDSTLAVDRRIAIRRIFPCEDTPIYQDHDFPTPGYLLVPSGYLELDPSTLQTTENYGRDHYVNDNSQYLPSTLDGEVNPSCAQSGLSAEERMRKEHQVFNKADAAIRDIYWRHLQFNGQRVNVCCVPSGVTSGSEEYNRIKQALGGSGKTLKDSEFHNDFKFCMSHIDRRIGTVIFSKCQQDECTHCMRNPPRASSGLMDCLRSFPMPQLSTTVPGNFLTFKESLLAPHAKPCEHLPQYRSKGLGRCCIPGCKYMYVFSSKKDVVDHRRKFHR